MASKPRVLAIVPARGGSKGIPLKNLKTVAGKSLLARTLELAQNIPEITDICVSTDHPKIKEAALSFNGVAVINRPEDLSTDRVADSPVLQHATAEMEEISGTFCASSSVLARRLFPATVLRFLSRIPLLPPRAGTIAKTRGLDAT